MNMNNSPKSQIDEIIAKTVGGLIDKHIIKPNDVANKVNLELDPEKKSPSLVSYSSMMQLRNAVRQYLARQFDPETKAQESLSGQTDMLSGELQGMYPVKREEFGSKSVYIDINLLTDEECRELANRCFKIGDSYTKQGRALLSYANDRLSDKHEAN